MPHKQGTRVIITITDKGNPHSPVTTVRGYVSDESKIAATVDDGHPVWHGAELRFGRSGGVSVAFKSESRAALEVKGVKEYRRPVRCHMCRNRTTLATKAPYRCLECCVEILRNPNR